MRKALCLAVLLTASGCITASVTERSLLTARRAESDRSALAGAAAVAFPGVTFEEHRIEAADGTALYGAMLRQPGADLTVLYFGGNGSTVEQFGLETAGALLLLGVNVFLVDHRGYGWSDGTPTVALLQADALVVFDRLAALPDVGGVVVHGLSLGSFLASHVGANRDAAGVVLESSATTPEEWARARIPMLYRPFVRIRFEAPLQAVDNRAEVRRIEEPLLLLVGDDDDTTPPVLSRGLFDASPLPEGRKALVVVEGAGHGDVLECPASKQAYRTFLARVRAAR